jgi:hypothetical protein
VRAFISSVKAARVSAGERAVLRIWDTRHRRSTHYIECFGELILNLADLFLCINDLLGAMPGAVAEVLARGEIAWPRGKAATYLVYLRISWAIEEFQIDFLKASKFTKQAVDLGL